MIAREFLSVGSLAAADRLPELWIILHRSAAGNSHLLEPYGPPQGGPQPVYPERRGTTVLWNPDRADRLGVESNGNARGIAGPGALFPCISCRSRVKVGPGFQTG